MLTAEQCYVAARDESLVLAAQGDSVARGAVKQHETGFVNVMLKKGTTTRYFGKVRLVYLSYYHLPEQAALTVARHHARVEAAMVQVLRSALRAPSEGMRPSAPASS